MGSKLLKKLAIAGLILYSLNKMVFPLNFKNSDFHISNPLIQNVMQTDKFNHLYVGNKEDVALKYLKLGHAVTMKHMDYGILPFASTDDDALLLGVGDCSEMSRFTYSNFLSLINKSDNPDLAHYVRLAFGTLDNGTSVGLHSWLEFHQGDEWVNYESTRNDLFSSDNIAPNSINKIILSNVVIDPVGSEYIRTNYLQITPDGKDSNISFFSMFKAKGFVGVAYDRFTKN